MAELFITPVFGRVPQIAGGLDRRGVTTAAVVPRPSTSYDAAPGFCLADVEHQNQQMAALLQHMLQVDGNFQTAVLPDGGHSTEPIGSRS